MKVPLPVARYREFQPCAALRPYIRALFTFTLQPDTSQRPNRATRDVVFGPDEPFWSGLFADGHASIVFSFGDGYSIEGLWDKRVPGHVIGPMSCPRSSAPGRRLFQIGAYIRAAHSRTFTGISAHELQDRVAALADLWGSRGRALESRLFEQAEEMRRIEALESALLACVDVAPARAPSIDIAGLARWIPTSGGNLPLHLLASRAGVSRQYLTRIFHEQVGMTPKLYSRLARFSTGLALVSRVGGDWADTALQLGYSDQSHMIAEFREFSGRTPAALARSPRSHPFLGHL